MAKGLASINIKFSVDLKQFSTEMQNSLREIDKFGRKMTEVGKSMSLYISGPLIAAGAASIKFASDYQESLNKVDVAFAESSGYIKEFAKDSLKMYGISEGTALNMASNYGDMATSLGLPREAAAKMSTSLVALAGDLASFKNLSLDEVNTGISAIFTGETESLKRMGIVMTEANLQAFAFSKGIKTQIKDMDQASKVNLRYAYIMQVTKNSQGDFVRTGGNAANQMRIFQESMKQLGQQFGSIILPYFTKLITGLNGMISGFSNLGEGTKATIVIFAGVIAAAGPLLIIIGQMATGIPVLVSAFGKLRTAMAALSLSPNPYVLLATAIAAIGVAVYAWYSSNQKMVSSKQALNEAIAKGNQEATNEVAGLDRLYAAATNVKLSIDERKKAVDELQSRFPSYFKNINDEIILNGKARDVYQQVREAIFAKSRAQAIEGELQKRANDRVEEELKLREKIAETRADIQKLRQGPEEIVIQEASAMDKTARIVESKTELIGLAYKRLAMQQKELQDFTSGAMKEDAILLDAKIENENKSKKLTQEQTQANFNLAGSVNSVNEAEKVKAGTIVYYEKAIAALKKQQNEVATTSLQWNSLQDAIDGYQAKIDAISKKEVKLPKPKFESGDLPAPAPFSPDNISSLQGEKSYYEGLRNFSTSAQEYQRYSEMINGIQLKINAIEGIDAATTQIDKLTVGQQRLAETAQMVGQEVSAQFDSFANSLVESFGLAETGFQGFVGSLLKTVAKLISMYLAQSIASSIAGATASGAATGPAAIFTTPAFIATAVGGVLAAFAAIPKFATGGIVGGSSKFGDKIMARVNSGEMIANEAQQQRIWSAMNNGGGMAVNIGGTFRIAGTDLIYVLDRANKKKDRTG